MKKLLGFILVVVTVLTMSACSSNEEKTSNLAEKIKQSGEIVIGTNSGYPPYEFIDTRDNKKELVGYDIDLGNLIAKELGVKAVFKDMDFDALIPSLISGKVDIVLAGMVETDERKQTVDFSLPYVNTETVAVALKSKIDDLDSAKKLANKTAVVQVATTQETLAENIEGLHFISLPTVGDTIASLTSGQSDVLLISEVSAKNIVKQYPEYTYHKISGVEPSLLKDGAAVMIDKNQDALTKEINTVISNLDKSGQLESLFIDNVKLYDAVYNKQ